MNKIPLIRFVKDFIKTIVTIIGYLILITASFIGFNFSMYTKDGEFAAIFIAFSVF